MSVERNPQIKKFDSACAYEIYDPNQLDNSNALIKNKAEQPKESKYIDFNHFQSSCDYSENK